MILDTNAFSALADGDEALALRLGAAPALAIPAIVLGEFRYGIRSSRHRATYEAWLKEHLHHFEFLDVDADTATAYADIRHDQKSRGKPIPGNDLWIAACARQHGRILVTRDAHFAEVRLISTLAW